MSILFSATKIMCCCLYFFNFRGVWNIDALEAGLGNVSE
jgi:hypothetical protein